MDDVFSELFGGGDDFVDTNQIEPTKGTEESLENISSDIPALEDIPEKKKTTTKRSTKKKTIGGDGNDEPKSKPSKEPKQPKEPKKPKETVTKKRKKEEIIPTEEEVENFYSKYKWSPDQIRFIEEVEKGKNVFLTGMGGVGKSQVGEYVLKRSKSKKLKVSVCAYTGIAAMHIGGKTLHSLIGCDSRLNVSGMVNTIQGKREVLQLWTEMQMLFIDEISMMDPFFFQKCNDVISIIRGNTKKPFGGIQLVIMGDFLQLPPVDVTKPKGFVPSLNDSRLEFCFELPLWKKMNLSTIYLTKVFRQKDVELIESLGRVRLAEQTYEDDDMFMSCVGKQLDPDDPIQPTRLYPFKKDVEKINIETLDKMDGDAMQYDGWCNWSLLDGVSMNPFVERRLKKRQAQVLKDPPVEQVLYFKQFAQVVLMANILPEKELVNGSRGVVVDFSEEDYPIVAFTNGIQKVITPHKYSFDEEGCGYVQYFQVPLRLAWCLTIHKCQGMSLDKVVLSMKGIFAEGQAYVALSRIKNLDGLYLEDYSRTVIKAHPKVVHFYKNNFQAYKLIEPGTIQPSELTTSLLNAKDKQKKQQKQYKYANQNNTNGNQSAPTFQIGKTESRINNFQGGNANGGNGKNKNNDKYREPCYNPFQSPRNNTEILKNMKTTLLTKKLEQQSKPQQKPVSVDARSKMINLCGKFFSSGSSPSLEENIPPVNGFDMLTAQVEKRKMETYYQKYQEEYQELYMNEGKMEM